MIYGEKESSYGSTLVKVKNEYGMILYSECFGGPSEQVQVIGSGNSVTILADCPGNCIRKMITQTGLNDVRVEPIAG